MKGKRSKPTDYELAFYDALGQRIRALREEKRLALEAVAKRSGITARRLAYLEEGIVPPSFPMLTLGAIAQALGVKTFDLFNVEHRRNEVAGLLEDLRGATPEKIQAARVELERQRGASAPGAGEGAGGAGAAPNLGGASPPPIPFATITTNLLKT